MLFKTKDKIIEYAELTGTINFNSVKPTIKVVEQQHIIPILGQELYTGLNNAYTAAANEDSLTDEQKTLLEQCRCVIGPMLCYYYAPKAEVKVSDAGLQRMETTNAKSAYQNQVTNYREQNLREGELATELLLRFLETNKADYTEWTASDAFKEYRSLFIKSGQEFDKLFTSSSPYRNYWAMRSQMLDVEENSIRNLLGDTLYKALKAKDQDAAGTFTDKENMVIYKVKKVIAYLTVANAIPLLNIRIDANGITVMTGNAALNDNLKRTSADKDAVNAIIDKCQAAARSWINNVENYLNANATDFDGWPIVSDTDTDGEKRTTITDDSDCYRSLGGTFGLT